MSLLQILYQQCSYPATEGLPCLYILRSDISVQQNLLLGVSKLLPHDLLIVQEL